MRSLRMRTTERAVAGKMWVQGTEQRPLGLVGAFETRSGGK